MDIIIIGGVAAGTKAAAKLKRQDRSLNVTVYTKGSDISYAGCGLPYYVSGTIKTRADLIVNTPQKFANLTSANVVTMTEAIAVNPAKKTVTLKDFLSGETNEKSYDKLIIATGAEPFVPNVAGKYLPGVFTMRTPDDAINIRDYVEKHDCKSAVVVGGSFIGLEAAENLQAKGVDVTVVDMAKNILPGIFDFEMADYLERKLQKNGIAIRTGEALKSISGTDKAAGVVTERGEIKADLVVLAIGIRPVTAFLDGSGIEMEKGAIITDEKQQTNLPDIYAVGDCALVTNRQTGKRHWSPMGSTANITGRCLAKNITGDASPYLGAFGTGVIRLFDGLNAGRTGLTEEAAKAAGYDAAAVVCVTNDKAHYYPGAGDFVTKLVADKTSRKLLGIQVIGPGAIDKMVDIAVTGIAMGAKIDDFDTLDFAYAPPFSTAIHPFVQACYILENKLAGCFETISPAEYLQGAADDYKILDVAPNPVVPGAKHVNVKDINGPLEGFAPDDKILIVCVRGKMAYFSQIRLRALGYKHTRVLEGATTVNVVKVKNTGEKLSAADIKRVKALGALWDKRTNDVFNVRVITRNGKITAAEQHAIVEASEKFGNGELTMTTRLTLEIQGVKYANIEPLIAFLKERGLDTGGTGSLVRPVVSCKGTTCQYGLLDSFALSQKLHDKFYLGYRTVTLPHKFKIAVGGCPNNCVKPDLNDLGIVGQLVPNVDLDKCRGCKKCQVEAACPIKEAKVIDGKIKIDPANCNNCGRCKGKCLFGAITYEPGYRVYLGGRWGKKIAHGRPLSKIFKTEEELLQIVEGAILLFRDEGISGERFADTINRLGFDYVEEKLLSQKIDKDAVLQKNVVGGASC